MKKECYLIGTDDMPGMAVVSINANSNMKKVIAKAIAENLDADKVEIIKLSDFNHKTFQQEALAEITKGEETETENIYLTPITIYK